MSYYQLTTLTSTEKNELYAKEHIKTSVSQYRIIYALSLMSLMQVLQKSAIMVNYSSDLAIIALLSGFNGDSKYASSFCSEHKLCGSK